MPERNLTVALAAATAFAVAVAAVVVVSWARPAAAADGGTSAVGEPPLLPASAIIEDSVPGGLAMQISVVLRSRDPQGLAAMARQVSTPGSPDYRQFLKPGQFAGRFGASATTIAAVRRALTGLGLHPGPAAPNGLSIPVPTTAAAAESAFGVRLRHVRLASGRVAFADDIAPRLPSTIASAISGLVGLDDLAQMHPHWQTAPGGDLAAAARTSPPAPATTAGPQPCAAATNAATATGGRTADQLAHAYNFGDLYSTNTSGSGVTVAVFELASYAASDVAAFQSCYGSSAQVGNTPVDGGAGTFDFGALEVELDIEGVISLAPQAKVAVYTGPNNTTGVLDTLSRIVSDDTAQVVSDSWGLCEAGVTSDFVNQESAIFQQAAVQGQTLLAAAGDSGSADCSHSLGVSVLAVDDPASQPFVTGVGGTTLSAVSPTPSESVWNETAQHLGAGGGGISSRWPMPAEQQGPGVVNRWSTGTICGASTGTDCREVPDVSASADPTHGYIIYYAGAESGISGWQSIGGTSAAAPFWAAAVALADQSCSCSIGFLNPALYNLAATGTRSVTDITSGNNDYGGANGGAYPATPGYDMASGLGTPMVATLAAQLGRPAAATFTADTPPATADLNRSFSYTFAALGHPSPTFSIATGALPPGVALNPVTGVLSGTPTLAGTFTFTVAATNGIGVAAQSSAITLAVAAYVAPIITSAAATTFTVDYLGNFTGPSRTFMVTATGNPPPRISATGLFG
ncbi:MAG: hypothetical protein QOK39_805, partial [Acidimicrobiaceae bacterium]|nr:hypothetical protein [Acidimicrobiaceae bacterium]